MWERTAGVASKASTAKVSFEKNKPCCHAREDTRARNQGSHNEGSWDAAQIH